MIIKHDGIVSKLLAPVELPRMFRAKQVFPREVIAPEYPEFDGEGNRLTPTVEVTE